MMTPEARLQAMAQLNAEVEVCHACPLHAGRKRAVPGEGALGAQLMFIGEAPGFHEDEQGLPFVGRSGQLLNQLLNMIGMERAEVFIANVVKCRPPENRDPLPAELDACKSYLDRQIELINPLMIATLGRFSMARYFPNGKITQIHGQPAFRDGRIYYPLFHPAAVLRNENLRPIMEQDFKRIPELLAQAREGRLSAEAKPPTLPPNQLSLF